MLVCKKCSTVIVNAQPIVHYSVCIKCRKQEADKFNGSDTISIKDINKQMRSHTVTKVFGHPGTEEFVLPAGDSIIANMKDKVEELILDKIYTTPEDLLLNIKKLPSILGKFLKV